MNPFLIIALIWAFSSAAFLGGLLLGRGIGRRQALQAAAAEVGDEACREVLGGRDEAAGVLFELSQRLRQLGDPEYPPAFAGDDAAPTRSGP